VQLQGRYTVRPESSHEVPDPHAEVAQRVHVLWRGVRHQQELGETSRRQLYRQDAETEWWA